MAKATPPPVIKSNPAPVVRARPVVRVHRPAPRRETWLQKHGSALGLALLIGVPLGYIIGSRFLPMAEDEIRRRLAPAPQVRRAVSGQAVFRPGPPRSPPSLARAASSV